MRNLYHVTRPEHLPAILREGAKVEEQSGQRMRPARCWFISSARLVPVAARRKACDCMLLVVNQDALMRELFRP